MLLFQKQLHFFSTKLKCRTFFFQVVSVDSKLQNYGTKLSQSLYHTFLLTIWLLSVLLPLRENVIYKQPQQISYALKWETNDIPALQRSFKITRFLFLFFCLFIAFFVYSPASSETEGLVNNPAGTCLAVQDEMCRDCKATL